MREEVNVTRNLAFWGNYKIYRIKKNGVTVQYYGTNVKAQLNKTGGKK